MASSSAPYYTAPVQKLNSDLHCNDESLYPDLGHSMPPSANIYSLAGGALQAHEDNTASQFAGLIQAATAAAGQEATYYQIANGTGHRMRRTSRQSHDEVEDLSNGSMSGHAQGTEGIYDADKIQTEGNERYPQETMTPETRLLSSSSRRKRKRGSDEEYEGLTLRTRQATPAISVSTAHSSGVHSATALFRRPSTSSKKYTRPPMSKLYTSLELSPENFLRLQAAAKTYMLDPSFPQRRDCVGQRGKGDSELVKLRLWNCVKEFLESKGHGERFFGSDVLGEDGARNSMTWPTDRNNIIRAVTPLLRRMVTNERQRQYAVETRKGGVPNDTRKQKLDSGPTSAPVHLQDRGDHESLSRSMEVGLRELQIDTLAADFDSRQVRENYEKCNANSRLDNLSNLSGLPEPDFNGLFAAIHYHVRILHSNDSAECSPFDGSCEEDIISRILATGLIDHGTWHTSSQGDIGAKHIFARLVIQEMIRTIKEVINHAFTSNRWDDVDLAVSKASNQIPNSFAESNEQTLVRLLSYSDITPCPSGDTLKLHLNVLAAGQRVLPRLDTIAEECPSIQALYDKIPQYYTNDGAGKPRISVHLSDGLSLVRNDAEWEAALFSAKATEWMDHELKVVIDIQVLV